MEMDEGKMDINLEKISLLQLKKVIYMEKTIFSQRESKIVVNTGE